MKVYVLFIEQVDEGEILRQECTVYASEKDARDSFNCFVCDETRFISERHQDWIINDDPEKMEFEAYENGYYAQNHTNAFVTEEDVL